MMAWLMGPEQIHYDLDFDEDLYMHREDEVLHCQICSKLRIWKPR